MPRLPVYYALEGAANIAGTAFCVHEIEDVGPFTTYAQLVEEIVRFFDSGIAPVKTEKTLEIFRFMQAADKIRKTGRYVKV